MLINIGDTTKEHMEILNIKNFPFTEEELSRNFRFKIKQTHEDVGGSKEGSRKVLEAREYLKNLVQENLDKGSRIEEPKQEDLFSIFEPCKRCGGTGTKKDYYERPLKCHICKGKGRIEKEVFNPVIPRGAVLF